MDFETRYKIVRAYIIGVVFFCVYFWMVNSSWITWFVGDAQNEWSAMAYSLLALFQYCFLVAGVSILMILTILLVKKRIQLNKEKQSK